MVSLNGARKYVSQEMTLARYEIASLFPPSRFLHPISFLENVAEIKKERALAKVGKKPDGKSIEDALLLYVPKEQIVSVVGEYLQKEIARKQRLVVLYSAKAESGPDRTIYCHAANEWNKIQTRYEGLLEVLKSQGLTAFAAEQTRLKPELRPSTKR